jgi:hypothetical protein
VEIVIPAPPNVDIKRKPSEEQLAQVLERTPIEEPEKNRIAVMFDKMKPVIASSGR